MQPGATLGLTFVLNTTGDQDDAVVGDGVCETAPGNGQCTLRAAIEEANAQPADDTITFDIRRLTFITALPDLSTNIAIQGLGPDLVILTSINIESFSHLPGRDPKAMCNRAAVRVVGPSG